jgi:hypothetical protein
MGFCISLRFSGVYFGFLGVWFERGSFAIAFPRPLGCFEEGWLLPE